MAKRYGTDLSDRAWKCIKDLLPERKKMGRPRDIDLRELLNAIFYVHQGGSPET